MGTDKMKTLISFAILAVAMCSTSATAQNNSAPNHLPNDAIVYYYDFGIQRITGLHEDEINAYGCMYVINKEDFLHMLSIVKDGHHYQALDVRANVVFAPTQNYFVDRAGAVRFGDQQFELDKHAFVKAIKQHGVCRTKKSGQ